MLVTTENPKEPESNICEKTNTPSSTIVQHLWNYCNILRDDGMCYGDYVNY